jgi:hypothetical protein
MKLETLIRIIMLVLALVVLIVIVQSARVHAYTVGKQDGIDEVYRKVQYKNAQCEVYGQVLIYQNWGDATGFSCSELNIAIEPADCQHKLM